MVKNISKQKRPYNIIDLRHITRGLGFKQCIALHNIMSMSEHEMMALLITVVR